MAPRWKTWLAARRTQFAQSVRPTIERWSEDESVRLDRDFLKRGFLELQPDAGPQARQAVRSMEEVFANFKEERASYMHALHETKRRMALLRRMEVRHPWWEINAKQGGYRFAAAAGIEHPKIFGGFVSIDDVDPSAFGGRFLVKPKGGSTNRGIYGLVETDDGSYADVMNGGVTTWDEVTTKYRALVDDGKITPGLVIEELLTSPHDPTSIPDDFKLYCFYDRVELVMQRTLNKSAVHADWRFKFWDRDWNDLGPVKYADRYDASLPAAAAPAELIETAERLGKLLRVPFARLDFYDTDRGVVFGEFTLNPGPPEVFAPEVDEFLGRHREFAAARLMAEDVESGYWDHLLPPAE